MDYGLIAAANPCPTPDYGLLPRPIAAQCPGLWIMVPRTGAHWRTLFAFDFAKFLKGAAARREGWIMDYRSANPGNRPDYGL